MHRLDADALTWTALLSKWIEFAQASLALPDDAEGERWRRSVGSIITLQAVTFALAEIERLPVADRAVARDKAEVLIETSCRQLERLWIDDADDARTRLPPMMEEVCEDAFVALDGAQWAGLTELVHKGDEPLVMPAIDIDALLERFDSADGATLAIAQPGTIIVPGEPFAWWHDLDENDVAELTRTLPPGRPEHPDRPRQVYRLLLPQLDERGAGICDVVRPLSEPDDADDADVANHADDDEPAHGLPLLVPILVRGERIGSFTMDAEDWRRLQRDAARGRPIRVIDRTSSAETG
jgi:hypothetical protein